MAIQINVFALMALVVFLSVAGMIVGVNLGVALSYERGPKGACHSLPVQLIDCATLPAPETST